MRQEQKKAYQFQIVYGRAKEALEIVKALMPTGMRPVNSMTEDRGSDRGYMILKVFTTFSHYKVSWLALQDKGLLLKSGQVFQQGDRIVRLDGDRKGYHGEIEELDYQTARANVRWDRKRLRTWIRFDSIALVSRVLNQPENGK